MSENKAEKSLRWLVNQIPDFEPKTNEEKMLLNIKFYCDAGASEISRLTAENERLRAENAKIDEYRCVIVDISEQCEQLKAENAELKAELQKLKPNTQRKATDKMIEYAKIIASYTNKPLPNFNNFDETQNYIRKNRQSYLECLEIDSEANALVIDSRRDY